eukprot:3992490-Lingulodinium_polyedra.AAC.1
MCIRDRILPGLSHCLAAKPAPPNTWHYQCWWCLYLAGCGPSGSLWLPSGDTQVPKQTMAAEQVYT